MAHRRSVCLVLAIVLTAVAPASMAAHYTLTNGGFAFVVPDGWPRILESAGDPEMQVFQVPDASVTSQNALARITVSSQRVSDVAAFKALIDEDNKRAQDLPNYQLDKSDSTSTRLHYTATDGSVAQDYRVHYYLHNGYALEVECVRPAHTDAGRKWVNAFKKGCRAIADSLR